MNDTNNDLAADKWSGDLGRNWLANLQRFEDMIAPLGAAALARAAFKPGERVIDLGCGGGGTTIAIARAVSPGGHVTGLDISPDLIAAAGARARQSTEADIAFLCADAASVTVADAPFDRLFSRFGSMFFPQVEPAFRNLRRMVKDGGRIDLVLWAPPADNPWFQLIRGAVAEFATPPANPPDPRAPGPFALADVDRLNHILEQADFGEIEVETCQHDLPVGGAGATPQEAAEFAISGMSAGAQVPQEQQAAAAAKLAQAFMPYHVPGKGNLIKGTALLVSAKAV